MFLYVLFFQQCFSSKTLHGSILSMYNQELWFLLKQVGPKFFPSSMWFFSDTPEWILAWVLGALSLFVRSLTSSGMHVVLGKKQVDPKSRDLFIQSFFYWTHFSSFVSFQIIECLISCLMPRAHRSDLDVCRVLTNRIKNLRPAAALSTGSAPPSSCFIALP